LYSFLFFHSKKNTMSRISIDHAKRLIKNYADNKIGRVLTGSDPKAIWFPKELLLDLLNEPLQGVSPNGLRFYFGAYETLSAEFAPRYADEENKITLVIFPTTGAGENGEVVKHPFRTDPQEFLSFDLLDKAVIEQGGAVNLAAGNDGQHVPPPPRN
jgi:hypothetical protein